MSYAEVKDRSSRVHPIRGDHGGRVYEAARYWGIEPHEVLDFSANINPLVLRKEWSPQSQMRPRRLGFRVYPDAHAFLSAIVRKHLLMPDEIVVGSGRRLWFSRSCMPSIPEGS